MNDYVVVKLITGEMVIGTVYIDNKDYLVLDDPLIVKNINFQNRNGIVEKSITRPFCNLTDDRRFSFKKEHTMFVKSLSAGLIDVYEGFVNMMDNPYPPEDYTDKTTEDEELESFFIEGNETTH